jgi:signal transduction histidine kinase
MRRRLLTSTLTIVIATVALFGIPLGFVLDRVVHEDAQSRLDRDASRVSAELAKDNLVAQSPDDVSAALKHVVPSDDRLVVHYPSGRTVVVGDPVTNSMVASSEGPQNTTVTISQPVDDVDNLVTRALFLLVLAAVVALGGALALALVQSSRLSAPLARLARSATRLGEGDFSLANPRTGLAEIDEIGAALDRSAASIDQLLRAERSFSSHASHQLRSALTGIQLRLEELSASDNPEVRAEADAAFEQASRLNGMIDELLALARTGRAGIVTGFDLSDLARQHANDAQAVLARDGRRVSVETNGAVPVVAAVGAVGQVLDILLSNATRHGRGTVKVRVSNDGQRARVDIEDEGKGIAPDDLDTLFNAHERPDGHGIGLSLARTLATTEGGTLSLARPCPPVFRVELPLA